MRRFRKHLVTESCDAVRLLATRHWLAIAVCVAACSSGETRTPEAVVRDGASSGQSGVPSALPSFKIFSVDRWGPSRTQTAEVNVFVIDSQPSADQLKAVARAAAERTFNSKNSCFVFVRLHDPKSSTTAEDVSAFGTARPIPTGACISADPSFWEWEYHVFPK